MRKFLSFVLCLCMITSLCACGSGKTIENNSHETSSAKSESIQSDAQQGKTLSDTNDGTSKETAFQFKKPLTVSYINVGQGDSEFIELPNGETMLIDAGNKENASQITNYIKGKGYNKIDYVVATHPHSDHIGAMASVLCSFNIGKMYMPKKEHTSKTFEDLLNTISQNKIKLISAKSGTNILSADNLSIKILAPSEKTYSDLNNYSAVIKITYKSNSFLFMGDAESEVEQELLNSKSDIASDVIKIGHHGSSYSSTPQFINAVSPKYAVISCKSGNQYGHPHNETLDTLKNYAVNTYRTDEQGTIVITSDGVNIVCDKKASVIKENAPPVTNYNASSTSETTVYTQPAHPDNGNDTVYKTNSGKKYHSGGCSYLSKSQIQISLQQAKSEGLTPCSKCNPPQ